MDKKKVYKLIRAFEYHAGESFTDRNESIVNDKCLMFWMLGKGYIDGDAIVAYTKAHFTELNNVLCGYEDYFALFPYGEVDEDCHFKAMSILAEFISEVSVYQIRLQEIVNKSGCMPTYKRYEETFNEEYEKAEKLSVEELRQRTLREETKS